MSSLCWFSGWLDNDLKSSVSLGFLDDNDDLGKNKSSCELDQEFILSTFQALIHSMKHRRDSLISWRVKQRPRLCRHNNKQR